MTTALIAGLLTLVIATILSPLGAYVSQGLDRTVLLWMFVGFLLFAAGMMLLYQPKQRETESSKRQQISYGLGIAAKMIGNLLR